MVITGTDGGWWTRDAGSVSGPGPYVAIMSCIGTMHLLLAVRTIVTSISTTVQSVFYFLNK